MVEDQSTHSGTGGLRRRADASASRIAAASRASCGCFAAVHAGRMFPPSTRRLRLAGVDCRSGWTQASGPTSGEGSSANLTKRLSCDGTRRSATGRSRMQKPVPRHRQKQTRKGCKAHGDGRRLRWTSESSHFPGGSRAHRVDARASSRPAIRSWPFADEAATAHLRQGSRQQRPAVNAEEEQYRADLSPSVEPQKADSPRWSFATPLPSLLDHRKDCGLAQKLPKSGHLIRAQVQAVPGLPEGRLPDDHPSTGLKPLLVTTK